MTVNHHLTAFHGLPVRDVTDALDRGRDLAPADGTAWRIALSYDDKHTFEERWLQFLDAVDTAAVRAVVIGPWWQEDYEPVDGAVATIAATADRLPGLRALFLGDVTFEECEISWLEMADVTPLLNAFPGLEEFGVRGGSGLRLGPVAHPALRVLRLEAGGLPAPVVRAVGEGDLPALESLHLWLGVDEYGGDWTLEDLQPFLTGTRFPALRRLGLENSEQQDDIAAAVATAPVVARLEHLSLAMGALTDEGAAALLEGQPLTHLASLDLHHHYLTEDVQQRVTEALAGVEVDLSGAEDPDDEWRYVAVAE